MDTKVIRAQPTCVRSAEIETENPLMCERLFLTPAAAPSKMGPREKVEPMFLQKLLEFRTLDAASGWLVRGSCLRPLLTLPALAL